MRDSHLLQQWLHITTILINPIEMILTHPVLFNGIVVLFIVFTSGWLASVISGRKTMRLKKRVRELEYENRKACKQITALQQDLEKHLAYPLSNIPVIHRAAVKENKTN